MPRGSGCPPPPTSWLWLLGLTAFGACIGLSIALAFTRQLRTLAERTEFLARRNFSFPVELEADGEVAPLVSAINELLESVRDYARRSIVEGLISFSRDGRVLSINPRAAVALGVDADLMIGCAFSELIPDVPDNAELRRALVGALEHSEAFDLRGLAWTAEDSGSWSTSRARCSPAKSRLSRYWSCSKTLPTPRKYSVKLAARIA